MDEALDVWADNNTLAYVLSTRSGLYAITKFQADPTKYSFNNIAWYNSGSSFTFNGLFVSKDNFYVVGQAIQINSLSTYWRQYVGIIMTFNASESRFALTD